MNLKCKFHNLIIALGVIATAWQLLLPQYAIAAVWHIVTPAESLMLKTQENTDDSVKRIISETPNEISESSVETLETIELTEIKSELTPKEAMRAWVLAEVKLAGLNPKEVDAIIHCESRWDDQAVGYNHNGSNDKGLWQINSIHKLSDAEKLDYKIATKWAIEKRLRDGNWSAWYCARKLAIK